MTPRPPLVFISYSHDSQEHQDRVLALANRLRADGVNAEIDQYEMLPPRGWPAWCDELLRKADFVLMVCTEGYLRRVDGTEERGKGHGVLWEARLIRQHLYNAGAANAKFLPVLLSRRDESHIPVAVAGATRFRVDTDAGYVSLLRLLTNRPEVRRPPVQPQRPLPQRPRASLAEIEKPPQPEAGADARGGPSAASGAATPADSSAFAELYQRFKLRLAPHLAGRQLGGLSMVDAIDWILRSLQFDFRREWLDTLERYAADNSLPEELPRNEEAVIRQLRNLGLITHDGRWLFEPTRSRRISPTAAGELCLDLHRDDEHVRGENAAGRVVSQLAEIVRDPRAITELADVQRTGRVSDVEAVRKLRNLHLLTHSETFLPGDELSATGLGEYVLRCAAVAAGYAADRPQGPRSPTVPAIDDRASPQLVHPSWARSLWSEPAHCKFHIVTSRYATKRRWRKYADILVEITDPAPVGATGEAYLLPSNTARPALRDAAFLTRPDGKDVLARKKRAAREFIERSEHRLLSGVWFLMPPRNGTQEIGVYCAAYDERLNDALFTSVANDPRGG
jgi:hypothetical protein